MARIFSKWHQKAKWIQFQIGLCLLKYSQWVFRIPSNQDFLSRNGLGLMIFPLHFFKKPVYNFSKCFYLWNESGLFNNGDFIYLFHILFTVFIPLISSSGMCSNSIKRSFKVKLCSFVSFPSLFMKEINAFDSFSIEWLVVTVLSVNFSYGFTLMFLIEMNFVLFLWILWKIVCFWNPLTTLAYQQPKTFENVTWLQIFHWIIQLHPVAPLKMLVSSRFHVKLT